MAGDTITTFWGEFLIQPTPLEGSFNWCSHNCAYCFANLNQPNRTANLTATNNLLSKFRDRHTVEAQLLQQGYGVLVSNRVDPFATSNYKESIPVMQRMVELGIPLALQTKGGKGIEWFVENLQPSCWYITITTLNEALRQQIEPGAPSIESRFELIERLVSHGHTVYVGLNPWTEEWCPLPDARRLLERAKQCGAFGVWTEVLHFNWKQVRNMPDRAKTAIGDTILKRAQKRGYDPVEFQQWLHVQDLAREIGLEVYSINQGAYSEYFEPYKTLYPKTFETLQGFINLCHTTALGHRLISYQDFADFLLPTLPSGTLNIGHYLGTTNHAFCKQEGWTNWMTYDSLLRYLWENPHLKGSPSKVECFAIAQRQGETLRDSEGLPYLAFSPQMFDSLYTEV